MDIQTISLDVSVEDLNKILTALGSLPYIQVFDLIHRIQLQAEQQLQKKHSQANGSPVEPVNL